MKQIVLTLSVAAGLHGLVMTLPAADVNFAAPDRKSLAPVPYPPAPTNSPVHYFRHLLALSPPDRAQVLAAKTPETRKVLEAKLSEFASLTPAEAESRLQMMQLRLHLRPLMQMAPTNRAARLASVPPEDRRLVEDRLRRWDIMPPQLRQEILDNELALQHVFRLESSTPAQRETLLQTLPPAQRERVAQDMARWQQLSEAERQRITRRVEQFFNLSEKEKGAILSGVAQAQREQLQHSLRSLQQLSKAQRDLCLEGLSKFNQLTPQQRLDFLKNCERWQAMTPGQQKAWRDTVARVAPQPPLPPVPAPGSSLFNPQLKATPVAVTNP